MSGSERSVLVISATPAVSQAIESALSGINGLSVRTESSALSNLNGAAVKMAAGKDVIIFETTSDSDADMEAIRALSQARRSGTRLLALAGDDIPLSRVRALNRIGVDEVLPSPLSNPEIALQIRELSRGSTALVPFHKAPKQGRIVVVAQARGGVGATTVAVNLANELLLTGGGFLKKKVKQKVALLDLDVQFGSVGALLDLPEQDNLHRLALEGTLPDHDFIEYSTQTTEQGLSVLAAPSSFMPLDSLSTAQIGSLLDLLRLENDFVVVDLPHALGAWTEPVLKRADELLVVTDTSVPAIRHCRRLIDFFTQDNTELAIRIVVNRESPSVFGSAVQKEAQKALDRKLDTWLPQDARAARSAIDRGKPLSVVAPRSALGKAIARLARETEARAVVAAASSHLSRIS